MFGVSLTELLVVFVVALLLFGPEQLPQLARQLGRIMGEVRKGSDSLRREFYNVVYPPAHEIRREFQNETRSLKALKAELLSPLPPPSQSTPKTDGGQQPQLDPAQPAQAQSTSHGESK